jgi:hypothetical protein
MKTVSDSPGHAIVLPRHVTKRRRVLCCRLVIGLACFSTLLFSKQQLFIGCIFYRPICFFFFGSLRETVTKRSRVQLICVNSEIQKQVLIIACYVLFYAHVTALRTIKWDYII